MKDNTEVFSHYSVPKAVASMALPSMLGMLVNIIYNLADTFFVGQTGNSNQVAAVSISMPLFLIFMAIGNLFGVGGCAFISRTLGEGKKEKVKTISSFCIYGAIAIGTLLGIIFIIFRKQLLYLVGASDNTIGFASDYLMWCALGSPFVVTAICSGSLIRGEGATKVTMCGMMLGQITNIILDPIFILSSGDELFGFALPFGLGLGVSGAAIATVIGNILSVIFYLAYFLSGRSLLSISPKYFSMKNGILKGVINVGLPVCLNNLLMSISNMIGNTVLASHGDIAVAAMGVASKANMLVVMLQIGLAQGVQPLIGYCYGAKNFKRMRKCMSFSMGSNIFIGTSMMLFYFVFRENVITIFIDNPEVVDLGIKMLTALMLPGPVIGIMFIFNFAFQAMGKGVETLILSIGRQGLFFIPLLFILNKLVGLDGIIWAQAAADYACVLMSFGMFLYINKGIKKQESQLKTTSQQ